NYSNRADPFVGNGWLCFGDSHPFNDPIFSYGVSFALIEARAAGKAIRCCLAGGDWRKGFTAYRDFCQRGRMAALDVIRYFWGFPVLFGYLSRGELNKEIVQLLGSDCHGVEEGRALQLMRNALRKYSEEAA